MKNYEPMFILRSNLNKNQTQELFDQINQTFSKNKAAVTNSSIWAEKKKLNFPIKKCQEGTYYLVNFTSNPQAIAKISQDYKLNENILRVLITGPNS